MKIIVGQGGRYSEKESGGDGGWPFGGSGTLGNYPGGGGGGLTGVFEVPPATEGAHGNEHPEQDEEATKDHTCAL